MKFLGTRTTAQAGAAIAMAWSLGACAADIPVGGYTVVHTYPHDTHAFTEGLFYDSGYFYESTGRIGESSIRKVALATGEVVQRASTPAGIFGEGIVASGTKLVQLSWQEGIGFVYDKASFKLLDRFRYPGEGWAMTRDANHVYMSDGTPTIRILDPETFARTGSIEVTANGEPLQRINELEWVKGQIFANVWQTNHIARIDPKTGHVVGWIDLTGLMDTARLHDPDNEVLNGIAYDAAHDRLFVTGKYWPSLFEIRTTGRARW